MTREMKYSGVEWIGDIPSEWKVKPISTCFNERNEKVSDYDWEPLSVTKQGILKQLETAAKSDAHDARKKVCAGDFVINSRSDRKQSCGVSEYDGSVSLINIVLKHTELLCSEYIKFALKNYGFAEEFYRWGNGIVDDLWSTNYQRMKKIMIPIPPLPKQKEIANFLDGKVSEIDKIIAETKSSIENYKEYKQSVITEAVTKGLDKNVPMKDSGIEWIGEIPCEWQVAKLKHSIKWKSVKGNPEGTVLSLYRDYGVIPKESRDDNHNVTSLDTFAYKVVDVGDFVINKMKAWQGSMAISEYNGIISPAYHICQIINPNIYKKYFHYLLRNHLYLPEYTRLSTGMRIGQWDLGYDDFKNLSFIIPTYDEQVEIAKYLDKKCAEIDNLILEKEKLITNLEEYKKSLIYEYVTGKKAVK